MSADKNQMEFPSLDFPGRQVLYVFEMAAKLGCHIEHIYNLIEEGQIAAIDISGRNNLTERRCLRIPIESYRKFISERTI